MGSIPEPAGAGVHEGRDVPRPPSWLVTGHGAHDAPRLRVEGKFLFAGTRKFYVRGATYGTFRPDGNGTEFPSPQVVESDFARMARSGMNAVRTYTPPPGWLLDAALRHGLRVMVGIPIERSAAFIDYRQCTRKLIATVRSEVGARAGHPAVLCYALGNEIPASVVRWHGARKVEDLIRTLSEAAREADPAGLVTYVNYPSTEYLQLPFLDLVAFNVYLETRPAFEAYLAHLHNITGGRPVLMTEIGLDSLRNGEKKQATSLGWQVRASFAGGCAGAFVYAWTDEWHRGGADVEDWKFGITDRERRPKPALDAVRSAFSQAPFLPEAPWPRISVVICSYNGSRTIRRCCQAVKALEYPDFEAILVNDGSTDGTGQIAEEYGLKVITTPNRGLSSARNTGLREATGEIVAYLDDDAYPDPHWLHYLACAFLEPDAERVAGVGGPNIPPADDGPVAQCVARAPGGPSHVLISDRRAEHIPGCNMAFVKSRLEAIGGFDPQFRVAGDDVDVCWRLQKAGWSLGYSPSAVVWHHRRSSVRAYLRQQRGYGQAEAMLEPKWPEKYNTAGYLTWAGRIYDGSGAPSRVRLGRIYHGTWGLAPFQSLYQPGPSLIEQLPLMPEWYLLMMSLALLSTLGILWRPLMIALPLLALAVGVSVLQAFRLSLTLPIAGPTKKLGERIRIHLLTGSLNMLQPLARLSGRTRHGLTFWRRRILCGLAMPRLWVGDLWSRRNASAAERLESVESSLRNHGGIPRRGGEYNNWDFQVDGGTFGGARLWLAVEHHGDGRQLLRFRCRPYVGLQPLLLITLFGGLALAAAMDGAPVSAILGTIALLTAGRTTRECSAAQAAFLCAFSRMRKEEMRGEAT